MSYEVIILSEQNTDSLVDLLRNDPDLPHCRRSGPSVYLCSQPVYGIVLFITSASGNKYWPQAKSVIQFNDFKSDPPSEKYLEMYHRFKPYLGNTKWLRDFVVVEEPVELRRK